jgi:hypothetical protein
VRSAIQNEAIAGGIHSITNINRGAIGRFGWSSFLRFGPKPKRINHHSPVRFAHELWMAGKKGEKLWRIK